MPTRAYIAHDRVVTVGRMYLHMAFVGLLVAAAIYAGGMYAFFQYNLAEPVPALVNGKFTATDESPRLRARSLLKYYVSLNPQNYISFNRAQNWEPQEMVEPELRVLLRSDKVTRETYRKAVILVTHGRAESLRWVFPLSLLWFPAFGIGYFALFSWINRLTEKTEFVRGTDMMPFARLKAALDQAISKENTKSPLRLGEVLLPESVSRRHMLVLGTSGTGKSVCLNRHIASLKSQGKSIIYDVKGEFCGKHFDKEGDILFYPFDKRSIPWSFFNEIRDYPDLDILCTSLYEPPKESRDAYWYNAARDVFRTGLFYLLKHGKTNNRDIWEFFSQPLQDIRQSLGTLPVREIGALKHIDKADSNQAASVISILQERLTFFRYLCDSDGRFSFREFIRNEKHAGNLFLMNIRRYDAIFRPLMTFVIDIMIREVLSLSDSFSRRITFVVDEFGSLSKMPSIFDFLTMGRSKGGFLVLANQDLGSVSNIYGQDQKETFFNNFNVHLVFRLNDPTTAEFLSKAFGEREVIKKFKSSSFSPSDVGDRFSLGEQEKLEKVILPTEFQQLRDFHTYLKIANIGVAKMETKREFLPSTAEEFIQRDFALQDMLEE